MIIGICGFQNSGKDTIANYLVEKYGFVKISFADVLKDIVAIIFNWDRKMLQGDTKESREWRETIDSWWAEKLNIQHFTPRYALQFIGTNLFRHHFNQDIWTLTLERKLTKYTNIVITDCRFENEIELLEKYEGKIVSVMRGCIPEWYKQYIENNIEPPIHSSEYNWIKKGDTIRKFDYEFVNNTSLDSLYQQIDNYIKTKQLIPLE
jgi:hypothetical protein